MNVDGQIHCFESIEIIAILFANSSFIELKNVMYTLNFNFNFILLQR